MSVAGSGRRCLKVTWDVRDVFFTFMAHPLEFFFQAEENVFEAWPPTSLCWGCPQEGHLLEWKRWGGNMGLLAIYSTSGPWILLYIRITGRPHLQSSDSVGLRDQRQDWGCGERWEFACLTDFQEMLKLLVWDNTWRLTPLKRPFRTPQEEAGG